MSARDGVQDADYDALRATGLTREQCWAILDTGRRPNEVPPPNPSEDAENRRQSGVRPSAAPTPDPGPAPDPGPPPAE